MKCPVSERFSTRICTGRDIAQRPLSRFDSATPACRLHIVQPGDCLPSTLAPKTALAQNRTLRARRRKKYFHNTTPHIHRSSLFFFFSFSILFQVRSHPFGTAVAPCAARAALSQALHRSLPYSSPADVAQRACWARRSSLFPLLPRPLRPSPNTRTDIAI